MQNLHHQLARLLQLVLLPVPAVLLLLLLLPLLLPGLLSGALGLPLPAAPGPQVLQDGLRLAAIDHLLQPLVLQLVTPEVGLLQAGAVGQRGGQLLQPVVGHIQALEETETAWSAMAAGGPGPAAGRGMAADPLPP